ncbi:MAG: DNA replication and repair protein RecF [Fretibacterium sp.]|nr:DNA replication and repair protein RecF [Fretibacterium sp.]
MRFVETASRDFRNLKAGYCSWGEGLNFIIGPNGAGKTNLLESLNVISGWGPFGGGKIASLVSWTAPGPALLAASVDGERCFDVEAMISSRTTLRAGGERVKHAELRSRLPSLAFLPSDINLVEGAASVRRHFLDRLCALWIPVYARRLSEYRQLVRHRCALLRQNRSVRVTTIPFIKLGGWVRECRRRLVELLRETFLSEGPEILPLPISFELHPAIPLGASAYQTLEASLEAERERERYACRPLSGPHRDDLRFFCNGRPAALSLSRGQKRRLILRLILAAGRVIEGQMRLKPILLFDDLGAELDAEGRALAGRLLAGAGWQVFVTGTEIPFPDVSTAFCHRLPPSEV